VATCGRRIAVALVLAAALASTGAAAPGRRVWCEARPNAAWRRVLARHVVPLSRRVSLDPWTLAHDGRSFFATVYSPGFSGVARVDVPTGRITRVKAFPNPTSYQADGAFGGRRLVWSEYHGFDSFDDFTVWSWDSWTGKLERIGRATRAPDGRLWPSPWRQPDVRGGIATWAQGVGPGGRMAVHVFDLRSGRDRVVRVGLAQGPFLLAGYLVAWPESSSSGTATTLRVASALTRRRLRTPRALRMLRGVSGLATDGRRIAYPNASYTSLWWAPSLRNKPHRIVAAKRYDRVDNSVQVGGRYLGFGTQPRVFVGDTRTRRYVQITAHGGWTRIDARSLLVLYATGSKSLDARAPIAFVPLRDLPRMPACS
jgi:hypothetical protein